MLVLSRKVGETVVIDECIKVTITAIHGNKVCLGIEAPPDISVHREEIARRIREFAEPVLIGTPG